MTKNIHTASIDTQTFTRTSTSGRVYSHMVVGKPSYELVLAIAKGRHTKTDLSNWAYYNATIAQGRSQYTKETQWCQGEAFTARCASDVEDAKRSLKGATTFEAYQATLVAEAIARVEQKKVDGVYDTWCDLGWSSRQDLAAKNLGTHANHGIYGELKVLEASVVVHTPKARTAPKVIKTVTVDQAFTGKFL